MTLTLSLTGRQLQAINKQHAAFITKVFVLLFMSVCVTPIFFQAVRA